MTDIYNRIFDVDLRSCVIGLWQNSMQGLLNAQGLAEIVQSKYRRRDCGVNKLSAPVRLDLMRFNYDPFQYGLRLLPVCWGQDVLIRLSRRANTMFKFLEINSNGGSRLSCA